MAWLAPPVVPASVEEGARGNFDWRASIADLAKAPAALPSVPRSAQMSVRRQLDHYTALLEPSIPPVALPPVAIALGVSMDRHFDGLDCSAGVCGEENERGQG